jgi:hypothetical protein
MEEKGAMVQTLRDGILKSNQLSINKLLNWRKRRTLGMAKGCKLSSIVYEKGRCCYQCKPWLSHDIG